MKRNYFILAALLLITSISIAQSKFTETVSISWENSTPVQKQSFTVPSGYTYSGSTTTYSSGVATHMGMTKQNIDIDVVKKSNNHDTTITVEQKTIYRTIYTFPLNSIKYTATNNINITNVKINYSTTGNTYTFKITHPNSCPTSGQEIWSTVGSSSAKVTGVTYSGSTVDPASGLAAPIKSSLASGYLYLGIVSESESTNGSDTQMGWAFSLDITYERDNEQRTVKAQNDLHGSNLGQIYVGGNLQNSPYSETLTENQSRTYTVKTSQNYDDYEYIWHQGSTNTSKWERKIGGTTSNLGSGTSASYTTKWNEVGTITHTAYMKRNCNLTFTGGGGTVAINGGIPQSLPYTEKVVEENTVIAVASNYTSGGITYTFANSWTTSSGGTVSTTITPSEHETYTANYSSSLSGNATLQDDMEVPTGSSVTIPSSATVNLNGHSIISTGGTITVASGATINGLRATIEDMYTSVVEGYCGTVQGAVTAAADYSEIYLEAGPFSESISISGKDHLDIYNGEITGSITVTNSDYLRVFSTKCSSIYVNNSVDPYFNVVQAVGSGSGTGLSIFNVTNPFMGNSKIVLAQFTTGLYAVNSTFGMEHSSYSWLYGATDGVSANYNSNITLNSVNLCNNSRYDMASYTASNISANSCKFNNGIAKVHQSGGTVSNINPLACGIIKRGNDEISSENYIVISPVEDDFGKINNQYYNFTRQARTELKERESFDKTEYKDDFTDIADQFKEYIKENSGSKYKGAAVTTAIHCYKAVEDYESMKEFIDEIKEDKEIGAYAVRFMIDYYQENKDYKKAVAKADELLKNANEELAITLLYAKGLVLGHDLKKTDEAVDCFTEIVKSYPKNSMVEMAKNQLLVFGVDASKELSDKNILVESSEIQLTNSPNPFNPTTIINYQLPEAGFVTLKVYDMLGKEVTNLVNSKKEAGKYSVNFDASHLASGVYVYRITVQSFEGSNTFYSKTEKMMLLK